MATFFHIESIQFSFNKRREFKKWISQVIIKHQKKAGSINIIFTSNEYLKTINQDYLNHNYFTDVITFNYNEEMLVSGDIFVSIEQVEINCQEYSTSFEEELARVVIHGLLHLLGFNDSTQEEKAIMREEEEKALKLYNFVK